MVAEPKATLAVRLGVAHFKKRQFHRRGAAGEAVFRERLLAVFGARGRRARADFRGGNAGGGTFVSSGAGVARPPPAAGRDRDARGAAAPAGGAFSPVGF